MAGFIEDERQGNKARRYAEQNRAPHRPLGYHYLHSCNDRSEGEIEPKRPRRHKPSINTATQPSISLPLLRDSSDLAGLRVR